MRFLPATLSHGLLLSPASLCELQVNYYIGVHMSTHLSGGHRRNWYVAYSLALGVIVALGLAKEIYNATVLRRRQQVLTPLLPVCWTPCPPCGSARCDDDHVDVQIHFLPTACA
jgi:hypothetical protein